MVVCRVWLSLPLATPLTPRPNNLFANCTLYSDMACHSSSSPTYFSNKVLHALLAEVGTFAPKYSAQKLPVFPVKFLRCFCSNSHHTTHTTSTKVAQHLFILITFLLLYSECIPSFPFNCLPEYFQVMGFSATITYG